MRFQAIVSLLTRLRPRPATPAPADYVTPIEPAAPPPEATPPRDASPFMRTLALALDDERAATPGHRPDPQHMAIVLAANQVIAKIDNEPKYTPRRPSLLPQIMETVADEDASLKTLARVISQDPELTGSLLRAANSALYRVSNTPIESLERAAALVGTQGVRTIVTTALMTPLATGDAQHTGRFGEIIWEQSLYSATAAESLASRTQDCDAFAAHLSGLLYGLGTVAAYRVIADQYATQKALQPDGHAIAEALDSCASVAARGIALNWGLSLRTQEALEAQSSAAPVGENNALGNALRFGRLAGALTLLCKHGKLAENDVLPIFTQAGYTGPHTTRVWERLVKAYVRP
jgi:HD-like signal output (HDOD) protein